jgi:hypothetical protein
MSKLIAGVAVAPVVPADVARVLEQYQAAVQPLVRHVRAAERLLEQARQVWQQYAPENWVELESSEIDLFDMVIESGISVAWVPRAAVVDALIAAERPDRYSTLVSASDLVLDDLNAALDRARGAPIHGHADACAFAAEAIAAARDGHWSATQALAASSFSHVLHNVFGYPLFKGLGKAYGRFSQRDVDKATVTIFKLVVLELATARALIDIDKADRHPFNRHGTQHGGRTFFSQANALAGLLLVVGWIREFTWTAERHPEVLITQAPIIDLDQYQ